jgi:membrane-bound lytic murein transglycosylase C
MKIGLAIIVVLMTVYSSSYAQEMDDLDAEFAALDAELDAAFDDQDAQMELAFQQVKLAVDRAYKGLTDKIQVNWGEDVVLPKKASWTTYNNDFSTRASFDFELGVYRVETIVTDDVAKSLLQLKHMAHQIAQSSPAQLKQQDVLYKNVSEELAKQVIQSPKLSTLLVSAQLASAHIDVKQVLPDDISALIAQIKVKQVSTPMLRPGTALSENTAALSEKKSRTLSHTAKAQNDTITHFEENAKVTMPSVPPAIIKSVELSVEAPIDANNPNEALADKAVVAGKIVESISTVTTTEEIEHAALNSKDVVEHVAEVVAASPAIELQEDDTGKPEKLVLTIPFINGYQKTLIETLLDTVKALAREYRVDVSLIMAIIETESSFNPMATSPIPAFGLMQLVPSTGGVDAYQFVYGEKKVVSPEYLYNQHNNLRLGTAYLHLLSNRYLGGVADPQSRLYCVLASYNIGIGNLAYTLVDRKAVRQAVKKANTMQPDQLYDFLYAELPAQETRNYLVKVLARKSKYSYLDGEQN